MRDDDYPELGTGETYLAEGRIIIHFGSPAGATYTERKRNGPILGRRVRLTGRNPSRNASRGGGGPGE